MVSERKTFRQLVVQKDKNRMVSKAIIKIALIEGVTGQDAAYLSS